MCMWPASCSPKLQPFVQCARGSQMFVLGEKKPTNKQRQKKKTNRQSQGAMNPFHLSQNFSAYKSWHKPPSWSYCTASSNLLTTLETFSCTRAPPAQEPLPRKNNFLVSFLSLTVTFQASKSLAQKMLL